MFNKISFGTAALGLDNYGISPQNQNKSPQEILKFIVNLGISNIDSAPAYGKSESIIGDFIRTSTEAKKIRISTKVSGLSSNSQNTEQVLFDSIIRSKRLLNVNFLDILYLHQNDILIFTDSKVIEAMLLAKKEGYVKELGISVYSLDEFMIATSLGVYDWIQVPANIFDVSFIILAQTTDLKGSKIAARSIFMQGAIFCEDKILLNLPGGLEFINLRNKYDKICMEYNISITQLAFSFINQIETVNQVIVGSRKLELWKNLETHLQPLPSEIFSYLFEIGSSQKAWTNPRAWKID